MRTALHCAKVLHHQGREQVSEYIPTTADVRDAYSSESTDSTYANRMFDAWLSRYKAKIVAKTEERIVASLERLWEKSQGTDLPAVVVLPEAIALIKGEK
jgi:hypothetical protein